MRDIFAACLGLVIVGALIILIGGLMFYPIAMEATQTQLLNTFMGMLATMAAGVVSFYFGSSSSGKTKDDTIQSMAKSSTTTANTAAVLAANGKAEGEGE